MDRRKRGSVYKDVITKYISSEENTLNILVCGKMGTGKSSLINSVIGKDVTKECQQPFSVTNKIVGHTIRIPIQETDKLASVTVWDTPGVGDLFGNDEDNLKEIAKKLEGVHLLLYCIDMSDRFGACDADGMKTLTKLAGPQIWKNAVLALTFANKVKQSPESKENGVEHFEHHLSTWKNVLAQFLEKRLKVPIEITQNIPVMPAGYRQHPLPDRDDWLSSFWMESFRMTKRKGQPILLGISIQRITVLIQPPHIDDKLPLNEQEQQTESHGQEDKTTPEEQPNTQKQPINIIVNEKESSVTRRQVFTAIGFAAVGAILGLALGPGGSILGAAIGGKIGKEVGSPSKGKGNTDIGAKAKETEELKPDWAVITEAILGDQSHVDSSEHESPQTKSGEQDEQF